MVRARVERPTEDKGTICTVCEYDALNDVVFSRGDLARVVRISAHLDGGYLTQYTCDGVIVSTPTGSTGYALAVSGPILPPELRNMLLIPIAPHLSMDRAEDERNVCFNCRSLHYLFFHRISDLSRGDSSGRFHDRPDGTV